MSLIICKVHLEFSWIEELILWSDWDSAKFKITEDKLHVPVVTISTKNNVNLTKEVSDGFKRSVYCNSDQTIPAKVINKRTNVYELLGKIFQCVKGLFVLAYVIAANFANNEAVVKGNRKYFLPKGKFENYNVLIDG